MKEIKDNIKQISNSWIGRINTVKVTVLPKVIYRFKEISTELLMRFFFKTRTNGFNNLF